MSLPASWPSPRPSSRHRALLACALATALAASPLGAAGTFQIAQAAPPAPDAPAAAAVHPAPAEPEADILRLDGGLEEHMTMPVEIGTGGPYPFIIDTGSYRSIVATELAERLALRGLPPVEIVSVAGRETVGAVHLDEIRFGTQVVNNLKALSVARRNLGSAGLIGLDTLQDKRVTLDFRNRELTIGKSGRARSAGSDRNVIVVQARRKHGQLILVDSKLDGRRVDVILDTGAEYSIGNMALYNNLKQKKLVIPPTTITIRSVTGQAIEAQFTVVRALEINSLTLQNVPMVFLDALPFAELGLADKPAMLLGMRMLRLFDRVAIDFGSRHVDFQLPRSGARPDLSTRTLAAL